MSKLSNINFGFMWITSTLHRFTPESIVCNRKRGIDRMFDLFKHAISYFVVVVVCVDLFISAVSGFLI